jgi:hypothetical protein
MMWRIARLDPDGALVPDADGGFEQVLLIFDLPVLPRSPQC